jgi:hypothetical protein
MSFQMRIMNWLSFGLLGISVSLQGQSHRLADIYKTGPVRLVEEIRITDAQLPDHAIFENPRGLAVDVKDNVYIADAGADHIKAPEIRAALPRISLRFGGESLGPSFHA